MKSPNGITQVIEKGGSKNEISKWYHLCDRTPWFPKLISKWSHFGDRSQKVGRTLAFLFGKPSPCFLQEDFLQTDFSRATAIYLYGTCLEEKEIVQLIQKFSQLSRKTRIITVSFPLSDYAKDSFVLQKSFSLSFPWGKTRAFLQTPNGSLLEKAFIDSFLHPCLQRFDKV